MSGSLLWAVLQLGAPLFAVLVGVLVGVVTGVTGAAVWALIVWRHSEYRSRQIEKQIKWWLSRPSFATWTPKNGARRAGLVFYNGTHVPVTIRSVRFIMSNPVLNFSLDAHGPSKKLGDQLKAGDEYGFMEMQPWTHARWGTELVVTNTFVMYRGVTVESCQIEAQYVTMLNRPKRVPINIPADKCPTVTQAWEMIVRLRTPHGESIPAARDALHKASEESAPPAATGNPADTTRGDAEPDE